MPKNNPLAGVSGMPGRLLRTLSSNKGAQPVPACAAAMERIVGHLSEFGAKHPYYPHSLVVSQNRTSCRVSRFWLSADHLVIHCFWQRFQLLHPPSDDEAAQPILKKPAAKKVVKARLHCSSRCRFLFLTSHGYLQVFAQRGLLPKFGYTVATPSGNVGPIMEYQPVWGKKSPKAPPLKMRIVAWFQIYCCQGMHPIGFTCGGAAQVWLCFVT